MARSKRKASPAELQNDPSLRWNAYTKWEALFSDYHNETLRFSRYDGDMVYLATQNGIDELEQPVPALRVRRPTVMAPAPAKATQAEREAMQAHQKLNTIRKYGS